MNDSSFKEPLNCPKKLHATKVNIIASVKIVAKSLVEFFIVIWGFLLKI